MSWQEELRKLDEALAAGQLSADDYRIRRDQVLSSAVADGTDTTSAQSGAEQEHTPQQESSGPQEPDAAPADATQVVTPVSPQQGQHHGQQQQPPGSPGGTAQPSGDSTTSSAEHTQHIQPVWQAQPTQQPPQQPGAFPPVGSGPQTNAPQHVPQPGAPAGGQPGQPGPQPGQPWNAPDSDASPPWGGSEFPPISPGSSEWAGQGPESFADSSGGGKGGKIALVAAALLLVVGSGSTAIFFATRGDDDSKGDEQLAVESSPAAPSPSSTVPSDPHEKLLYEIPELEGTADENSGVLSMSDLVDLDILDEEEAELLDEQSADKVAWRGSERTPSANGTGNEEISVLVIPLDDEETATELAEELDDYTDEEEDFTLIEDELPDIPDDVDSYKETDSPITYQGMWVSSDNVVRVEVEQGDEGDEAALSGAYQGATKDLLQPFPPVE